MVGGMGGNRGTGAPGESGIVVRRRFETQTDVIRQLGNRIEDKLRAADEEMQGFNREGRNRRRAAHTKLNRDYRRVEQAFKNAVLDARKRRGWEEDARRRQTKDEEEESRRATAVGNKAQLQMMMQEDNRISEEIMREREEEIMNINKGMHTVNEIYKV